LLKTEAAKSRKQRRTLKQLHEDVKGLGFKGLTTGLRRSRGYGGPVKQAGSMQHTNGQLVVVGSLNGPKKRWTVVDRWIIFVFN
jgi:hypothetical protein